MSDGKERRRLGVKLDLDVRHLEPKGLGLPSGVRLYVSPLTVGGVSKLSKLLRRVAKDDHDGFGRAFILTTCKLADGAFDAGENEPRSGGAALQEVVERLSHEDLEAFAREFPFRKSLHLVSGVRSSSASQKGEESRLAELHRLVRKRLSRWKQSMKLVDWKLPAEFNSLTAAGLVGSSMSAHLDVLGRATRMPDFAGEYLSSLADLERQLVPSDAAAKLIGEVASNELATAGKFKAMAHQYMLGEYMSALEGFDRQFAQADAAASIIRGATGAQFAAVRQFKTIADQFTALEDSIGSWTKALRRELAVADEFTRTLNRSLVPATALFGVGQLSQFRMEFALRPHAAFETFTKQQLMVAGTEPDIFRSNTLDMFSAASDLLAEMAEVAAITADQFTDVPSLSQLPDINAFSLLGRELEGVDFGREEVRAAEIVVEASPSQVVSLGVKIVKLVFNLNREAEREGESSPFKLTNDNLLGASVLSCRVAYDERSFGEIVDHLYFLLYEGTARGERLEDGLTEEQLHPLKTLNAVRIDLRHDLDHGPSAKVSKKRQKMGAIYRELVGRSVPRTEEDWAIAQVELYRRLLGMLDILWGE